MDLRQLEYFVRVAELGSFTRAAGVLRIVQPALSRQVRLLEDELQRDLLLRQGHGVKPTEAGNRLLEHARGILHQVNRAREDLGRVDGALAGRVAVGMPPTIGKLLTVPLALEFRNRLPEAALSITEAQSATMQEWLLAGRLDIALLYQAPISAEFNCVPLMQEELCLVSPRSGKGTQSAVTLKSIADLPLVLPNRPNTLRALVDTEWARLGCKPVIRLEIDAYPAILDLVAQGVGHSVLPKFAIAHFEQRDRYDMRPITRPKMLHRLAMATNAGRITTLTQQIMCELIQQMVPAVFKLQGAGTPAQA